MRRLLALSLLFAMIAGAIASAVATAQETTPGPAVGETSPIFSEDGSEMGSITVDNILEPFENYDAGYDPQRGYHYAVLEVSITNTGSRPMTVDPNALRVIDTDGFVADTGFIVASATDAPVFLEYLDALGPGDSAVGAIAYQIFNDSAIARIVYAPDFTSRVNVVDLREQFASAGTPVSVIGSSGSEIAQVTVNGIADPFEAYDEFSAPPRGSRYVLVDVTIANTGTQLLSTAPTDFIAVDDQGFYLEQPFVTSTDPSQVNFDYIDLAPGEQQQGVIYFQTFGDLPLTQIVYGDGFDRDIVVADLGPGAPPATPVATTGATPASPVASSPDCEGLVEWGEAVDARIGEVVAITSEFEGIEPADFDPVAVQAAADQVAALAQEQRDSNPPPAAEGFSTFLAEEFLQPFSDAATVMAQALENGDQVGTLLAAAEIQALSTMFDTGGQADVYFDELEAACPNEINELSS
jgi:hypothetical protein